MSTVEIKTTVSKATVYLDRAMVTRTAKVQLNPQIGRIQVMHLPLQFESESMRIAAFGPAGLTILDSKVTDQEYRDVPEAALKTLEEERQRFQDQIVAMRDEIVAVEHQKEFLKGISVGKTRHFSKDLDVQRPLLDDWKAVLDFLGREQRDLDAQRRDLDLRIRKVERDIAMIEAELQKHGGNRQRKRRIVTIDVEAKAEGEWTIELSYLMKLAQWKPVYDARVDSATKGIVLRYQGIVTQRSGEDWTGVEVSLSTARPQLDGDAPELHEQTLYLQPSPRKKGLFSRARGGAGFDSEFAMEAPSMEMEETDEYLQAAEELKSTVESKQGSTVVFRIPGRSDIPGDGGDSKLLVMESGFENRFRYFTVPKLAEWVYLTAEVTNGTEFPLLPGVVNIFMDGSFVGRSNLSEVRLPGEKFDLHLGVDESIKVTRRLQRHNHGDKGVFTRSHLVETSFLITLESHRDTAEEVIIHDQIPISQDEKVKVEVKLIQPAENPEKDKEKLPNGTIEWKVNLAPRTTQKFNFAYEVSHPKDVWVFGMEH